MADGKNTFYSVDFKQKTPRRYLESGISYRELSEQWGLRSKTQLQKWVAVVRRGDSPGNNRGKSTDCRKGRPCTKLSSVEEKLAHVEAELEYVKNLYRSRFGHEWGAHQKELFSK